MYKVIYLHEQQSRDITTNISLPRSIDIFFRNTAMIPIESNVALLGISISFHQNTTPQVRNSHYYTVANNAYFYLPVEIINFCNHLFQYYEYKLI